MTHTGINIQLRPAVALALIALAWLPGQATAQACAGGTAGGFHCQAIDLQSQLALGDLPRAHGAANDVWGYLDLNSDREFALLGLDNGVAVVDLSDAGAPRHVQTIPGQRTTWRDIKLHQYFDPSRGRWQAYAYVSADRASERLLVLDLSGLPNSVSVAGRETAETSAHNLLVANVEPGTGVTLPGLQPVLFSSGSDLDGGALRSYSLADPARPALLRVFTGHSHDVASVVIEDERLGQCPGASTRCVLAADASENDLQLWDVSDPAAPRLLAAFGYPNLGYVHSAAFTDDGRFLAVQDELDEENFGLPTTARLFDLADLSAPVLWAVWEGPTRAIDHNGFFRGNRLYLSTYTRGLTVLDVSQPGAPTQAGYFDTYPVDDGAAFSGAWGVYPYLPSGNLLVSDIQGGLFVLQEQGIDNRPGAVRLAAQALAVQEGESVVLEIMRQGSDLPAGSVLVQTLPGSAGDADFSPLTARVEWAAGESGSKFVRVAVGADSLAEDMERFMVRLLAPQGAVSLGRSALASVFVNEPGAATVLGLEREAVALPAAAGSAVAVVQRLGSAAGPAAVTYTVESVARTAAGLPPLSGQLSWADGDGRARSVDLPLAGLANGGSPSFTLRLSGAVGAELGRASVTFTQQESPPPPPAAGGGGGALGWMPVLLLVAVTGRRRGAGG